MSKQVQLRRGTTAQHATFTGAVGEVTYDTDRKCLVVHDGVTAGGLPLTGYLVLDPEGSGTAQIVDSPIAITGKNVGDGGVMLYAGLTELYEIGLSTGRLGFVYPVRNYNGVAYAPVLAVSCKLSEWQYLVLAGDVDLSASDLERGGHLVLRIDADGSQRNLTFPAAWRWLGAKPATIAANETGLLELWSWDGTAAGVQARWAVEA
jgi:hypothetical protein